MHAQLEILLQIQDLKAQRHELTQPDATRLVEEQEFHVDVERAVEELDRRIAELEAELTPAIRNRYIRISAGRGRAVVPVIKGLCYGCFVAIPTSVSGDIRRNDEIRTCDHCGRFLYVTG